MLYKKREFDILEYHNIVSVLDLTVYMTLYTFIKTLQV